MSDTTKQQTDSISSVNSDNKIQLSETVTSEPSSDKERIKEISKDLEKILNDIADTKTIAILGFFIVTIMVATMLVSVLTLFIQTFKDNSQTVHYQHEQR